MTPDRDIPLHELALAFLRIGVFGFGGVAPWARHVIVEERRWPSEADYAAVIGVGQALPGANTVNASVMIGDRFHGPLGAVVCVVSLMAMPILILIGISVLYAHFSHDRDVAAVLAGGAAAAAGLVVGTACKMARHLAMTRMAIVSCAAAFVAVGLLQWPLLPVLAILIPVSAVAATVERATRATRR